MAGFVNEGHEQPDRIHDNPGHRHVRKRNGQHRSAEQKPKRITIFSGWHSSENAINQEKVLAVSGKDMEQF
jgi:hypothetical protein